MAQILIVEESDLRLRKVQTALKTHKLVCTQNVERALATLQTRHFDLVLAPVYLDSGDVFHLIRNASARRANLRVVLYSTDRNLTARYATLPIQNAARSLGVFRYLLLPDSTEETLRTELENCISPECWSGTGCETGTIYEL